VVVAAIYKITAMQSNDNLAKSGNNCVLRGMNGNRGFAQVGFTC
jgi:hypothetical protein